MKNQDIEIHIDFQISMIKNPFNNKMKDLLNKKITIWFKNNTVKTYKNQYNLKLKMKDQFNLKKTIMIILQINRNNYMNVLKVVEESLSKNLLKNISKYVKKYFRVREKHLIQMLNDKQTSNRK